MPYIAACVDVSGMVLSGPFSPLLAGKSFDTCSKAAEQFTNGYTSNLLTD